jgi:hypothetical protein
MPQTAAADSRPRADEAILTPQAAAAVPGDLACGDDPEPDEPEDPTLLELYQQIAMMPQSAEDRAAAELLAAEAAREQEQRERAWKERLDQERRQQLEELDRRYQAFAATRRNPPDPGEHDPAGGGEAGRAPPDQG